MLIRGVAAPDLLPEDVAMIRAVLGFTAAEMAERLDCSVSAVLKWEHGNNGISKTAMTGLIALTATTEWDRRLERLEELDAALAEARERMESGGHDGH